VKQVVADAQPPQFKIDLRGWLRPPGDGGESTISCAAANAIEADIIEAIRRLAATGPLYGVAPENASDLYTLWARWGDRDEIRKHLEEAFTNDPAGAKCCLVQDQATFSGIGICSW
jgi:hypothetical protein